VTITIEPDEAGSTARAVGENTEHLTLADIPTIPRRPDATGRNPVYTPHTLGVIDDPTCSLPIVGALRPVPAWTVDPNYEGRHRMTLAAWLRRLIARPGWIGG
jgi:hypothetical protein